MWMSVVLQALRWVIGSGVISKTYNLVQEAEGMDIDGVDKWRWVWGQLRADPKVRDVVVTRGRYLINLAIEAAVAKVKG